MPSSTHTTAARLLGELLDDGVFTVEALATRVGVPDSVLKGFRNGARPIPLDVQLQLAILALVSPGHARVGHNLHGQVVAAMAYESGATTTHLYEPRASRRT